MTARKPLPLTVQNGEGGSAPRKDELVMVQGFLNAAIAAVGVDMGGRLERLESRLRDELKDGRDAHQIEHRELLDSLDAWKQAQEKNCIDQMAPYKNVDTLADALNWIACHRKGAAASFGFALSTIVGIAALLGGYFRAP
jgi:hypothetical protein